MAHHLLRVSPVYSFPELESALDQILELMAEMKITNRILMVTASEGKLFLSSADLNSQLRAEIHFLPESVIEQFTWRRNHYGRVHESSQVLIFTAKTKLVTALRQLQAPHEIISALKNAKVSQTKKLTRTLAALDGDGVSVTTQETSLASDIDISFKKNLGAVAYEATIRIGLETSGTAEYSIHFNYCYENVMQVIRDAAKNREIIVAKGRVNVHVDANN